MKSKRKVSIIGLWILFSIVVLYFGITYLKGLPVFRSSNIYYVRFNNVSSVATASPVKINGYKVGTVRSLDFDIAKNGSTVLALSINKNYRIPKDSRAAIRQGLLGGSEIDLNLGISPTILSHKDTIRAMQERPDYIEMLNKEVIPKVMAMLPKADSILSAINSLANDPNLPQTIKELRATMATAQRTVLQIEGASKNLAQFSRTNLPEIGEKLQQFSDKMVTLSGAIDSTELATIISDLSSTSASLQSMAKTLEHSLQNSETTMGALVNEKELYSRIDSLVQSTEDLVKDIKANPKKYLKISIF